MTSPTTAGIAPQTGWYVADANEQPAGPFTQRELLERCASGEFDADTLCWCDGMQDWTPLGETQHFAEHVAHSGTGLSARSIKIIGGASGIVIVGAFAIIAALGGREPSKPSASSPIGAGKLVISRMGVSEDQKMAGPFGNEPHYTLTAEVRNVGFKPVELSDESYTTEAHVQQELEFNRQTEGFGAREGESAKPLPWTLSLEARTGRLDGSTPPTTAWSRPMGMYWWRRESADRNAAAMRRVVIKPGVTETFTMLLPKVVLAGSTHRMLRVFLIDDQGRRVDEQTVKR